MQEFQDYEHFWLYYVSQHRNKISRLLHFCGTTLIFVWLAAAIYLQVNLWLMLLAVPAIGYSFAWLGHYCFEGNKPATFGHPFWSLRGDFRMYRCMVTGRMAAELEKSARLYPPPK